jgi:2-polyprenyl-3-methyl-5-hydroxy-6-metoxy-1,4-benzoquinol methylase
MAEAVSFWNKVADHYSTMPIADEESYQTKLNKTREYFTPDSNVLEFACGTGGTAVQHAPFVKHIHAIDISERMIGFCEQKKKEAGVNNVTFEAQTIENLSFESESFDVVMGMSILHLLEDKDVVIQKVFELLKPGGVFVSSTICLGDSMPFFRFIAPIGKALGKMPLVRSLRADAVQESFVAAGFKIEHRWHPGKKKAVFFVVRKPK